MPLISNQYGQSGDEDVELAYGRDIYNYFFHGDQQALFYEADRSFMPSQHFYAGFFNFIAELVHQMNTNWNIVDIRHFLSALLGALTMVLTGLFAYRLANKKWTVGLLALIMMIFSPRFFGESMFNGKDIPFAFGVICTMYFLHKIITEFGTLKNKQLLINALGMTIGWIFAFGARSSGAFILIGFIGVYVILYYWYNKNILKELLKGGYKKLLITLISVILVGYFVALLGWPYGLNGPLTNVLASFEAMANWQVSLRVLYDGNYLSSQNMPWQYELNWISISNPIIIIILATLFLILGFIGYKKKERFIPIAIIFIIFFPIVYIIYKNTTVYDTWRHLFFIYPFLVIAAALSVYIISNYINKPALKYIPYTIAILGMIPTMIWTFKEHPNQYVYFNGIVGGVDGAEGYYDLDYYLTSSKQSAQWILENVERPKDGSKIKVYTNMEALDHYFRNDTNWIEHKYVRYNERGQHDWDYYITYSRFVSDWVLKNKKWPPKNAIHTVDVADRPIGAVLYQKNKGAAIGHKYLENNEFQEALPHYEAAIKESESNENVLLEYAICLASIGRFQEAIDVMNRCLALDPTQPHMYQTLAQIYQAIGDTTKAQSNMRKAQSIMAESQRLMTGNNQ